MAVEFEHYDARRSRAREFREDGSSSASDPNLEEHILRTLVSVGNRRRLNRRLQFAIQSTVPSSADNARALP